MDTLKILVVDDESRMRKLVKDFLWACGCSAFWRGKCGLRVLARVRGERPDRSARGCGDGSSKLPGDC